MKLKIQFTGYWHCGSGRSGGKKADALVEKDAFGLPFVPGKTLKGILRDAVRQAEGFGHFQHYQWLAEYPEMAVENVLFGSRYEKTRSQHAGLLMVRDAVLDAQESEWLRQKPNLVSKLYRTISRTAIDQESGAAVEHSLRTQEVVVPMVLTASLDVQIPVVNDQRQYAYYQLLKPHCRELLEQSLVYIDGIGALRQRGLGRCLVTLEG